MPTFWVRESSRRFHSQRINSEGSLRRFPNLDCWIFSDGVLVMAPRRSASGTRRCSSRVGPGASGGDSRPVVVRGRLGPRCRTAASIRRATRPIHRRLSRRGLGVASTTRLRSSPRFEGPVQPVSSATRFCNILDGTFNTIAFVVGHTNWSGDGREQRGTGAGGGHSHGGGTRSGWCSPIGDPTSLQRCHFHRHSRCQSGPPNHRTRGA